MAWCPKCKNEYREGITVCADCGCELVDSLEEKVLEPIFVGPQVYVQEAKDYLEFSGVADLDIKYNQENDVFALFINEEEREQAVKLIQVFIQQKNASETEKAMANQENPTDEAAAREAAAQKEAMAKAMAAKEEARKYMNYRNSADRAEDNRSAAWSLLAVGGVGIVFIVLCLTNVISVSLNPLVYGVMGFIFLLFIVMGLVSFKSAKGYSQAASSEKQMKKELKTWCQENLTQEMIDSRLKVPAGSGEEVLFFHRSSLMKAVISGNFPNIDPVFLEHYIDEELYDVIFS